MVTEQDQAPAEDKPEASPRVIIDHAVKKPGGVSQFLKEVAIEHSKITWPDNRQVARETWSVIVLVSALTVIVLGVDWILGNAIFGPIEHWAKLYGAGLGRG
jgi:preprotein translocase SecE subunit